MKHKEHYEFEGIDLTKEPLLVMVKDDDEHNWEGPYTLISVDNGTFKYNTIENYCAFARLLTIPEMLKHHLKGDVLERALNNYDPYWNRGDRKPWNLESAIRRAFEWGASPEGRNFWEDVTDGKTPEPPKPKYKTLSEIWGKTLVNEQQELRQDAFIFAKNRTTVETLHKDGWKINPDNLPEYNDRCISLLETT